MVHSFIPSTQLLPVTLLALILHALLVRTDQTGASRAVQPFRTDQTGIQRTGQSFRSDQTSRFPLRAGQQLRDSNRSVKMCGKQLATMLSVVCNGKYYHTGKRHSPNPDSPTLSVDEYSTLQKRQISGDTESEQFQTRVTLNDDQYRTRVTNKRQISSDADDQFQPRITKKGIYDECCREQCKLSTLQEYCAD
uniref:Insulin-like domain-containing protein n=1 Tax=Cacopsylla melanoneura TaxID=428564 RepID=A0A8D9BUZ7_9HEMI